jgi:hypothetical protein
MPSLPPMTRRKSDILEMYVALNISNSSLKILSMKGRKVHKWGRLALEDGLVRDGLILQPQAVGEAINALFKSTRIPRENVITSLSGMSFTYRFLSLPRVKPALLEDAILRAAKKEISLPLEELYLSWQPLPSGEELAFFILGVPRNLVDAMIETLHIAGVAPYLMDLRPLALARVANRGDAIVASMDADGFDIVFIAGGIPRVIHTISPRGEGATLEDNIRRLSDELTKTAAFYQSNHPEGRLSPETPLLLTGELAAEAPTLGLLQNETEYPVEPLVPPVELPPDLSAAAYAASIGLALKKTPVKTAAGFHDININILSGKYRKKKAPPVPASRIIFIMLLVIAVAFIFPLYQTKTQLNVENAGLQTDLDNINREVNFSKIAAAKTAGTEETIRVTIAETNALKAANLSILGTRGDFTHYLQLVTVALPPDAYFTLIDIDNDLINVRGEANSVFTAVDYATALEATRAFTEVRITRLDEASLTASIAMETENTTEEISAIKFEIVINK